MNQNRLLVTGGAGFIGSALVRLLLKQEDINVVNIDALTYAGDLSTLSLLSKEQRARHHFYQIDITDADALSRVIAKERPSAILHLAAESHVDHSIDDPMHCVQTNIIGTASLLEAARSYWQNLSFADQQLFRFLHVSTDEVYGDIASEAQPSVEGDPYLPSSPYAASKAGADHLVRAWHRTYGLPVLLTHCCNNYGEYQYPEKLIPHMILNALAGKSLPLYGDGLQQRQWLYVEDHVKAIVQVLQKGRVGETYHIGVGEAVSNIDLVHILCELLEEYSPENLKGVTSYASLITHVADRAGHDRRYALASNKLQRELAWQAQTSLKEGLRKTVAWYVEQSEWWQGILGKGYKLHRQGNAT